MRSLTATLLILLASSTTALGANPPGKAPVATPTANPNAKPPEVNPSGFPAPDLKGYTKLDYPQSGLTDTTAEIPGKETMVETWQNKAGDRVMKMSLHGVTFAFGVIPGGDATKGYILYDPTCGHKLTQKYAPDAAFEAPHCAVTATGK